MGGVLTVILGITDDKIK